MAKEILLYNTIFSFTAKDFIAAMEENKDGDVTIRINCNGGDPEACWGMIAKMNENKKNVTIKVDGRADSAAAFFLGYAKRVEALDVSGFLLHRAVFSFLNESELNPVQVAELKALNDNLRKALENRVTSEKLKAVTGFTMDDLFDTTKRIDITLTATQAQQIGLVDKINPINEKEMSAINERMFGKMAAVNPNPTNPIINNPLNKNKMTLAEFQAAHPELFNTVKTIGTTEERDRVGAWMAFAETDIEAVKKGINDGVLMTQKSMTELTIKSISAANLKSLEAEKVPVVITPANTPVAKTAEQIETEKFQTELNAKLGIKTEVKA